MTNRRKATAVGILILAAYSSIAGFITDSVSLIFLMEATAGIEVILAAVLLYPLLRPYGIKISLLYLILKIMEGLILIAAALFLLFRIDILISLGEILQNYHH